MQAKRKRITLVECGCCSCYHPNTFWGDCRDDANRYASPEDYAERHRMSIDDMMEYVDVVDNVDLEL